MKLGSRLAAPWAKDRYGWPSRDRQDASMCLAHGIRESRQVETDVEASVLLLSMLAALQRTKLQRLHPRCRSDNGVTNIAAATLLPAVPMIVCSAGSRIPETGAAG